MDRFAVGSKWECINGAGGMLSIGRIYMITSPKDYSGYFNITADGGELIAAKEVFMNKHFNRIPNNVASPIREITRKEIVPGIYGQLKIGEIVNVPDCDRPDAPVALYAYVNFREACMTADELDAAASVLTQIAAVLRENQ